MEMNRDPNKYNNQIHMLIMDTSKQNEKWPDYTPLKQIVKDSNGLLAVDFPARVGARPYITYEEGEWVGKSVGPFDRTEDDIAIITTKELDLDEERVTELLENARLVTLRTKDETPIENFDEYVYTGLGDEDDK